MNEKEFLQLITAMQRLVASIGDFKTLSTLMVLEDCVNRIVTNDITVYKVIELIEETIKE